MDNTEDFSEENLKEYGINRKFRNENLDECIEEVVKYIESET